MADVGDTGVVDGELVEGNLLPAIPEDQAPAVPLVEPYADHPDYQEGWRP